jgi:hypothetical protein
MIDGVEGCRISNRIMIRAKQEAQHLSRDVSALVDAIKPLLAGRPAVVQGAALADLLARWLGGHIGADPEHTAKLHDDLLALHVVAVRELIPVNTPRPATRKPRGNGD